LIFHVGYVFQLLLEDAQFGLLFFEVGLLLLKLVAVTGAGRLRLVSLQVVQCGRRSAPGAESHIQCVSEPACLHGNGAGRQGTGKPACLPLEKSQ
jgi:hypothetical protein